MSEKISQENSEIAEILRLTVEVSVAYLKNNPVPAAEVPDFISIVHESLHKLNNGTDEAAPQPQKPAVSVRKSVTPDYLICLEDGKKLKMLKRHLRTTYSMTPDDYRAKWGLPADYPMVAPSYARKRSEFAKRIGLGRKPNARKAIAQKAATQKAAARKPATRKATAQKRTRITRKK